MSLQVIQLNKKLDELQIKHGDPNLNAIYGAGQTKKPNIMLVFMNPTARNVGSQKTWQGLKAPWLGTKNVWKMLYKLKLLDNRQLKEKIEKLKPNQWTEKFSEELYQHVEEKNLYITNLAKCTQLDARKLSNQVFKDYLGLFENEIQIIKPKVIITFGNQVSSIVLNKNISVSLTRKQHFELKAGKTTSFKVFPVYYPVGQGTRNIYLAIEDIEYIKTHFVSSD